MIKDIFDFTLAEKTAYETSQGVPVADGYEWSMAKHLKQCILYKDGKRLDTSTEDDDVPVKNIILPILNVHYRSEGFDVKDIEPYVNDLGNFHKSFLVRKYHEKWARKYSIDTFIDEVVESYVDFGGVLVKNVKGVRPEVIPLQKLAFCDQTDILSGPFAIKHNYSIDQLKEKSGVWDAEAIKEVCEQARYGKTVDQSNGLEAKTPGKYIEVYEVHGMFPSVWLTGDTEDYTEEDEDNYTRQMHIICFYFDEDKVRHNVTLFKGKTKPDLFKVLKRDKRFGTALGRSAIEELFEPQVWTTYSQIQIKSMLDKAAMILGVTDDTSFTTKNKLTEMSQGEWMIKGPNTTVEPFIFPAANLTHFENQVNSWEQHARVTGSASDPQLGLNPTSGTPLGTTQIVTDQGEGIHQYRRGQIATFISEIYRDWVLPHLVREMNDGQEFISELTLDELNEVADKVVTNQVNKIIKERVLAGKIVKPEEKDALVELTKQNFMRLGTKRFHKILKDEIAGIPTDVFINIAGKQKNLAAFVDKLSNIYGKAIANPAIFQDPNAGKLLNTILDSSGISPIQFKMTPQIPTQMKPITSPLQNNQTPVK